jgi:hypothetical protein
MINPHHRARRLRPGLRGFAAGAGSWSGSSLAVPPGFTFTRTGTATYLGSGGQWAIAAQHGARLDYQTGMPALLIEGARTNKVTAAKSTLTVTTNCTTSGDAAGVLSVAADATAINAAGLGVFGTNVYKIDNSAGVAAFYVLFGGTTGALTAHSFSAFVRGDGSLLLYDGTTETQAAAFSSATWTRQLNDNKTPGSTTQQLAVKCAAGQTAYVLLPCLEGAGFCSPSPIHGGTGTTIRNAESCTAPVAMPNEYTQFIDVYDNAPTGSANTTFWSLTGGAQRRLVYASGTNETFFLSAGGGTGESVLGPAKAGRGRVKFAFSRRATGLYALSVNGGVVVNSVNARNTDGVTTEALGHEATSTWGHASIIASSRVGYAVSDAELRAMST